MSNIIFNFLQTTIAHTNNNSPKIDPKTHSPEYDCPPKNTVYGDSIWTRHAVLILWNNVLSFHQSSCTSPTKKNPKLFQPRMLKFPDFIPTNLAITWTEETVHNNVSEHYTERLVDCGVVKGHASENSTLYVIILHPSLMGHLVPRMRIYDWNRRISWKRYDYYGTLIGSHRRSIR